MADQISSHQKPHAIMISVPYQGHINPFVNLALKLASKGLSITFVHLEYVHRMLSKSHQGNNNDEEEVVDFFSEARESGLDIRYTTISDGAPLEFDRNLHFEEYWKMILDNFTGIVDEFVGEIIKDSADPTLVHFLVADTVYAWPAAVAEKHNIVNVSFWTEPATVFSLLYHLDLLKQNGHFPFKDDSDEEIRYVPGVESINTRDLMTFLKEEDVATSIIPKSLSMCFEGVKKADFILVNTVEELEPHTLSVLNKYHPTYAIGPINFSSNLPTNTVTKSLWPESDCTHWLESKPTGSVLYVTFGSFVHTSKKVIEEIAYGLLHSGVSFIWAIRSGILETGGSDVLPDGFQDEIGDRGLIIPWCNQISVLSNPAVGGFMTHNGWNSTVESMWCGVPMICNPVAYDQVTNRKLVADDWKIGIRLCDKPLCVDRREVAEKIKSFMSESNWNELRKEAIKVKDILHNAMEIDGSSEKNFDKFIEDLKAKIGSKSSSSVGKKID